MPTWVLNIIWFLLSKLFGIAANDFKKWEDRQAAAKQAAADGQALANAKTAQDKENAANNINHDTFGS